jgi:lipoyl synthase
MVLGDLCTRRCPFCDVAHRRPELPDPDEPVHLAETIAELGLAHVVITSVDRDDLRDGGAANFAACIRAVRQCAPATRIEVLVPDFRGRLAIALEIFAAAPPDVMNHNLETVPRLYREARPGANYAHSLELLAAYKARRSEVLTKSGLILGLGETDDEVLEVMRDLRTHAVDMLTVDQYLQPRAGNLPVRRYITPDGFARLEQLARAMGFAHVACGLLVRSSYHADHRAIVAGAV